MVSHPSRVVAVYGGTGKFLSSTLNVGWFKNVAVGEYSSRITSGASTSKRASPAVTVALCCAVPFFMSIFADRLTGNLSLVAGLAVVVAAVAAVASDSAA